MSNQMDHEGQPPTKSGGGGGGKSPDLDTATTTATSSSSTNNSATQDTGTIGSTTTQGTITPITNVNVPQFVRPTGPLVGPPSNTTGGGSGGTGSNSNSTPSKFQPPARVRSTPPDSSANNNETNGPKFIPQKSIAPITIQTGTGQTSAFKPTQTATAAATTTTPTGTGTASVASPSTPTHPSQHHQHQHQSQTTPTHTPHSTPPIGFPRANSGPRTNQPSPLGGGVGSRSNSGSGEQLLNLTPSTSTPPGGMQTRPPMNTTNTNNPNLSTSGSPPIGLQQHRGSGSSNAPNPSGLLQMNRGLTPQQQQQAAAQMMMNSQPGGPGGATGFSPGLGGLVGTPGTSAAQPSVLPPPMSLPGQTGPLLSNPLGGGGTSLLPSGPYAVQNGQLLDANNRPIPNPTQLMQQAGGIVPPQGFPLGLNPQQQAQQQQAQLQAQAAQLALAAGNLPNFNYASLMQLFQTNPVMFQQLTQSLNLNPQYIQQQLLQNQFMQRQFQQQQQQQQQQAAATAALMQQQRGVGVGGPQMNMNMQQFQFMQQAEQMRQQQLNRQQPPQPQQPQQQPGLNQPPRVGPPGNFPTGLPFQSNPPPTFPGAPGFGGVVPPVGFPPNPNNPNAVRVGAPGMNLPPGVPPPTFNPNAVNATPAFPPRVNQPVTSDGSNEDKSGTWPSGPRTPYTGPTPPGGFQPPPLTTGLSAGPGATGMVSASNLPPSTTIPPVPIVKERKPLAIYDPATNKQMDFSDIKVPGKPTQPTTTSTIIQPITSSSPITVIASPSGSPALTGQVGTNRPGQLDLDAIPTPEVSERKPLAIVSPTTYEAEKQKQLTAATTANNTSTTTTAAPITTATPTKVPSPTPAPSTTASTSTAASTSSNSTVSAASTTTAGTVAAPSTSTSSTTTTTSTPSIGVYQPIHKRPVSSLSAQPIAGSGLPPSSSSDSLKDQLRSSAAGSPAPTTTGSTSAPSPIPSVTSSVTPVEAATTDEKTEEKSGSSSGKRGPILPGEKFSRVQTKRPTPKESATPDSSVTPTPGPIGSPIAKSSVEGGVRVVGGRTIYDRDFLMSFSHIVERPFNFPREIPAEIEVRSSRGSGSPGPRKASAGGDGDKWSRGQQLGPLTPGNSGDARRGGGMAPQGRGAFQQAQASAVRADQRNRDVGGRDSQKSGRDARGGGGNSGQRGGRDSGRGGNERDRRGGSQSQSTYDGPVAPLTKSENRWIPGSGVSSDMARIRMKVQSILNKLAVDKFDTLTHQLTDLIVENKNEGVALLLQVVSIIFDKALGEQFFSSMYADLCVEVSKAVAPIVEFEGEYAAALAVNPPENMSEEEQIALAVKQSKLSKKSPFRLLLLNKCQSEFEAGIQPIDKSNKNEEEIHDAEMSQKRRFLGNIKFIGELYKKGMLLEKIMHTCIRHLIGELNHPNEEDLEAACNLFMTVGKTIDHEKSAGVIDTYFDRFSSFSKNKALSSRIRFMCLDLIDLRKSGWSSRRKPAEVKSLEAVRKEAQAKAAAAASVRPGAFGRGAVPTRPTSILGRPSGVGSQDVRGGLNVKLAKVDRYSGLYKGGAATPGSPANPSTPAPPTPIATISLKDIQSKSAAFPSTSPTAAGTSSSTQSSISHSASSNSLDQAPISSKPSPDPQRSGTPMDQDRAASMIRSMIQEFIDSRSLEDAKDAIKELHSKELHSLIVHEAMIKCVNENKNRMVIAELCFELFKDKVLSVSDFDAGIISGLGGFDADFITDDMPKFSEFVGSVLGVWVDARCTDVKIIEQSAHHLIESGEAIKIFAHTVKSVFEHNKQDPSITRTIIESGGLNTLELIGRESLQANYEERATVFTTDFPFLAQLYPTVKFDWELRQAIEAGSATNDSSLNQFVSLLTSHSPERASVNFHRSIIDSILSVTIEVPIVHKFFVSLCTAAPLPTDATLTTIQLGVLHSIVSFVSYANAPTGVLTRIFQELTQTGLFTSTQVFQTFDTDRASLAIDVPNEIDEAIKAVAQ